jgi:hypothetical protein
MLHPSLFACVVVIAQLSIVHASADDLALWTLVPSSVIRVEPLIERRPARAHLRDRPPSRSSGLASGAT